MKERITVVKIGGAFLENESELETISRKFASMQGKRILVHGGGKRASQISQALGIEPKLIGGRRITDRKTLEVVTMVYGGWANKNLVGRLQSLGCNAIGLSGADADLIRAVRRPVKEVDYGYVGDVESVNVASLQLLLRAGLTPVFCALTHNGKGQLLNTNADTVAAEIAKALGGEYRTSLYYCFDKKGVLRDLNDPNSVIAHLDQATFRDLEGKGIIAEGMMPKLHNSFGALEGGVEEVCIGPPELMTGNAGIFTKLSL
ncbi:MAG: acetylglutamate kinase [Bacteroidetes bacterium]|jgi:acetylglutamate kinase|nr:MAG: acetylglutamate kinase [Bacteroidota bacterium]UCE69267.1 MAG: acetylglutamate kinase [Flavobacteriaceae bacterium]